MKTIKIGTLFGYELTLNDIPEGDRNKLYILCKDYLKENEATLIQELKNNLRNEYSPLQFN